MLNDRTLLDRERSQLQSLPDELKIAGAKADLRPGSRHCPYHENTNTRVAQILGWTLGIQDGQQLRPATPGELAAAATALAAEGRKIVVLTGKASGMVAVELLHTHGCRLGIEDFPKTWTASSPIRSLLFFAIPADQLPAWAQTCPQGVRVHADGSAVPLVGTDGWQGFQWFLGLAPTETPLADLPRELAVAALWPEPVRLPPGVDANQMTFNDLRKNGGRP